MKNYPLKFLDSYDKTDTDIFFGRDEEIDALYKMVFETDIMLLYGASGTGKTSLIQCGLASRFESHDWLEIFIRRGSNINDSLKRILAENGGIIEAEEDFDWFEDLEANETSIVKKAVVNTRTAELEQQLKKIYLNAFRPIYLIFDQFEELYILGNSIEQQAFLENVKAILALPQPVKMIFSIREEYLGYLYDFERAIPQLLKKKLRVEPMNITKVQEVITGATTYKNSNISIKKGELEKFTEIVFQKLQGRDETGKAKRKITIELPYLQVFLDKIYLEITKDNTRTADAEFSVAALQNIGEIDDVLRDFIEEQVVVISRQLREKYPTLRSEHIWKILSPFVTLDGTKEPIPLAVIQDKVKNTIGNSSKDLTLDLLESLIQSKIIRYLESNENYEIAHDSLAAKIEEKRSDEEIAILEVKRLIKSQALLKADAQELFTEKQLNFIEPYLSELTLESKEQDLIDRSLTAVIAAKKAAKVEQEAELKAAQAQAEKDRILREKAESASKRAKVFTAIAVVIALFAVGTSFYAWQQSHAAKLAKEKAQESLIKSYKSDINRYKREVNIYNDHLKSYQSYDAGNDVITLETNKRDSLENLVKDLEIVIEELK
jgi:hypothetical protein